LVQIPIKSFDVQFGDVDVVYHGLQKVPPLGHVLQEAEFLEKTHDILAVHFHLVAQGRHKIGVVVFGGIFCENFREANVPGPCRCFPCRVNRGRFVKQLVVVHGFDKRTHLVELPYLVLERDAVNVVRETNVLQDAMIQSKPFGPGHALLLRKRVHHVFMPQQGDDGAVRLVDDVAMVFHGNRRIQNAPRNPFRILVKHFGAKRGNHLRPHHRTVMVVIMNPLHDRETFAQVALYVGHQRVGMLVDGGGLGSIVPELKAHNVVYMQRRGRRQFKDMTDLHEFLDFFVDVIVADADDGIEGLTLHFLSFCLFLTDELDERGNAELVPAVHGFDFVHENGDFLLLLVHHVEDVVARNVVAGDAVNEILVARVARVILDDIVIESF